MRSLHELPKFSDRWSFLYLDMGRIDKNEQGLYIHDVDGRTPIPIDQLGFLMLGPGTSITHAAIDILSKNNCLIAWVGQHGVRLYAHSTGGTYSSKRIIEQARLASIEKYRIAVARRMYQKRFNEEIPADASMQQIRGMEGRRVRDAYQKAAKEYGMQWNGRNYDQGNWSNADPLNRAISAANACLYGICHAAIISAGFSPAIGFIHTGKMLSFVYDIADLYKTIISLPIAFQTAASLTDGIEREVRLACRDEFFKSKLMQRIIPEIGEVLGVGNTLGESSEDLEGKIVTLANRTENGSSSGESFGKS